MNARRPPMFSQRIALLADERKHVAEELAKIEKDLVERRAILKKWTERYQRLQKDPVGYAHRAEDIVYCYDWAQRLVASGERLRAYLQMELRHQPEYQTDDELVH